MIAGTAYIRDSERGQTELVRARYIYDEVNMRKARFDEVDVNKVE